MPIVYRRTRDQCAADTFAVSCSFPARFTFGGIVDRIALAGSSQDLHQLGQIAWLGRSVKAGGEALGGNPSRWQAR